MSVILYTTHCPKCIVLEKKLKEKNIEYEEITDVDLMLSKGFMSTPMLEINGNVMNFKDAFTYVNSL